MKKNIIGEQGDRKGLPYIGISLRVGETLAVSLHPVVLLCNPTLCCITM